MRSILFLYVREALDRGMSVRPYHAWADALCDLSALLPHLPYASGGWLRRLIDIASWVACDLARLLYFASANLGTFALLLPEGFCFIVKEPCCLLSI